MRTRDEILAEARKFDYADTLLVEVLLDIRWVYDDAPTSLRAYLGS